MKRSPINGKVTHFENNSKASVCYYLGGDSVTLIGSIEFVEDREVQESIWSEQHRSFFKKGIDKENPEFTALDINEFIKITAYTNTDFSIRI